MSDTSLRIIFTFLISPTTINKIYLKIKIVKILLINKIDYKLLTDRYNIYIERDIINYYRFIFLLILLFKGATITSLKLV